MQIENKSCSYEKINTFDKMVNISSVVIKMLRNSRDLKNSNFVDEGWSSAELHKCGEKSTESSSSAPPVSSWDLSSVQKARGEAPQR